METHPAPPLAVFFSVEPWEAVYLEKRLSEMPHRILDEGISPERLKEVADAEILSVFVWDKVDQSVLDALPRLKLVATRSTGFDHIDLASCQARGIAVANVPTYGENTVAEHTFALILALSRKVVESVERTRRANFALEGLMGFDLKDKTLGVVGVGHIGRHVLRIALGFEMNVLAYDPNPDPQVHDGFEWTDLDDLLTRSDIVSLHCPYNNATHHLMNGERIQRMKKGSYLINTARGAVVDTDALVRALVDGHLAGAGLDVLEEEALIKEERQLLSRQYDVACLERLLRGHLLLQMPNVIVTPHNAFNSQEALQRILETTLANISAFSGGNPINLVT